MRRAAAAPALLLLLVGALGAGCRRPELVTLAPERRDWEHCWWTVLRRSTLPPDSAVARFERAFTAAGLTGATRTRDADTVWAHGGPTPLGGGPTGATYESWAMAYRQGDTLNVRHFVAIDPPPGGWAQPSDTVGLYDRRIVLCGDIALAAGVRLPEPPATNAVETPEAMRRAP
ncbi:MAG TPA: hypothetical protein VFY16_12030 [Gemmatimonadaceae bacterium]|nr:hypothetical protein [Gemmatimonadaceae bacterium]